MHKIRQLKYPSVANPATDPAGGPAGEPRLTIPELKMPQKLTASVRATQTSLHKMKLMQISKIFQNTNNPADISWYYLSGPVFSHSSKSISVENK